MISPETFPETVCVSEVPETVSGHELNEKEKAMYNSIFLDYDATYEKNRDPNFPYSKDELIEHFKFAYLRFLVSDDDSMLSDTFTFAGPVVGPLEKKDFLDQFRTFNLDNAFKHTQGMHNLIVDPFKPNRVFFTLKVDGVHNGDLLGYIKATGKRVVCPPQVASFTFNNDGKIDHFTVGYPLDRHVGNSGGLAGLYGILYGVGKPFPFPECQPYKPSIQFRLFSAFIRFVRMFQTKKSTPAITQS